MRVSELFETTEPEDRSEEHDYHLAAFNHHMGSFHRLEHAMQTVSIQNRHNVGAQHYVHLSPWMTGLGVVRPDADHHQFTKKRLKQTTDFFHKIINVDLSKLNYDQVKDLREWIDNTGMQLWDSAVAMTKAFDEFNIEEFPHDNFDKETKLYTNAAGMVWKVVGCTSDLCNCAFVLQDKFEDDTHQHPTEQDEQDFIETFALFVKAENFKIKVDEVVEERNREEMNKRWDEDWRRRDENRGS